MRVIAGKYKSIKLNSLEGMNTRPTTDKVKENLFNMINSDKCKVLDLFAGSGALGVESLSRGASKAIFIDGSSSAIKIIYSNLEKCKIDKTKYEVYRNDYERAIKILSKKNEVFDLIFLDPPYNKQILNKAINLIIDNNIISQNGIIVVEKSQEEILNKEFKNLEILKEKKYGITDILIFEYKV